MVVVTSISSPTLAPKSAEPTGDSFEIFLFAGSASIVPTIVNSSVSPSISTVTVEPMTTKSAFWVCRTISGLRRTSSSSAMRVSRRVWASLAASYSEFSARSPNSRALWMRLMTFALSSVINLSYYCFNCSRPVSVRTNFLCDIACISYLGSLFYCGTNFRSSANWRSFSKQSEHSAPVFPRRQISSSAFCF